MKASRLLKEGFRAEDLVSRTGGDGFAILLPGLDEQQTAVGLIRFRAFDSKGRGGRTIDFNNQSVAK
jgi:GGDEF domain-containing protein